MASGARTPEELETLLEDAFVTRDRAAFAPLFDERAVLVTERCRREARGIEQIVTAAAAMWERQRTYLADPKRILQSRDTALLFATSKVSVARRGADGAWRYAIALLESEPTTERNRR